MFNSNVMSSYRFASTWSHSEQLCCPWTVWRRISRCLGTSSELWVMRKLMFLLTHWTMKTSHDALRKVTSKSWVNRRDFVQLDLPKWSDLVFLWTSFAPKTKRNFGRNSSANSCSILYQAWQEFSKTIIPERNGFSRWLIQLGLPQITHRLRGKLRCVASVFGTGFVATESAARDESSSWRYSSQISSHQRRFLDDEKWCSGRRIQAELLLVSMR